MKQVLIETHNLTKTYAENTPIEVKALVDINLKIDRGDYVVIMGASGSGKSTLLNLLGCLDTPTSGTYYLAGQKIDRRNNLPRIRRETIGFVFQSFNLIPQLTALENVEVPMIYSGLKGHARSVRARELLTEMGLSERLNYRPEQLSGGQKQRVAIARALANKPQLIIADEPTGNLDSQTSDTILDVIDKLNEQGITIIMVTHEEVVAKRAQRVIRLKDGRVVA